MNSFIFPCIRFFNPIRQVSVLYGFEVNVSTPGHVFRHTSGSNVSVVRDYILDTSGLFGLFLSLWAFFVLAELIVEVAVSYSE
jgi:hypothetical protein